MKNQLFDQILTAFLCADEDDNVVVGDLNAICEHFGATPEAFANELKRRCDISESDD